MAYPKADPETTPVVLHLTAEEVIHIEKTLEAEILSMRRKFEEHDFEEESIAKNMRRHEERLGYIKVQRELAMRAEDDRLYKGGKIRKK